MRRQAFKSIYTPNVRDWMEDMGRREVPTIWASLGCSGRSVPSAPQNSNSSAATFCGPSSSASACISTNLVKKNKSGGRREGIIVLPPVRQRRLTEKCQVRGKCPPAVSRHQCDRPSPAPPLSAVGPQLHLRRLGEWIQRERARHHHTRQPQLSRLFTYRLRQRQRQLLPGGFASSSRRQQSAGRVGICRGRSGGSWPCWWP